MLTLRGNRQHLCDRLYRRDLLRVGALAGLGLTSADLMRPPGAAASSPPAGFGRARRCVLLFLTGGPPQLDLWDLKPDAPAEIRGEFRPIPTSAAGIQIGEGLPLLARQAHRYCIVRSVTHTDTVHTSAGYTMLTGMPHPQANAATASSIIPRSTDHPHLGAVVGHCRPGSKGLPPFVAIPEIIRDDVVNTYPGQDGGFLGRRVAPLLVEGDPATASFRPPEIRLTAPLTAGRLEIRQRLWERIDARFEQFEKEGAALDALYQRAFDLIGSPAARAAFELDRESAAVREKYGKHLFGQSCLLARRLLEAGVTLTTVYWHYEGPKDCPVWDTHCHNFQYLRERLLPPTDRAIATFFQELGDRGLLDDTLVVVMGEFGRTPKINNVAGRDHWPHA